MQFKNVYGGHALIQTYPTAETLQDVNYNDGATELYKHLENRRWREAAERCRGEPIETKIWVYRMDKRNRKVLWRMLPIHTAILYRAPVYVILDLIHSNPEGPSQADDRKMLPIHMACRVMCKEDVLRVLLKHKMDTVVAKDAKGRTPRDILLDDKREQDSKVLKKVAERNKKNLLKILKEYEIIYERKNSAASVASSRWSRFGGDGDRSVSSAFEEGDEGSVMGDLCTNGLYKKVPMTNVIPDEDVDKLIIEFRIQVDTNMFISEGIILLAVTTLATVTSYLISSDLTDATISICKMSVALISVIVLLRRLKVEGTTSRIQTSDPYRIRPSDRRRFVTTGVSI